MILVICGVAAFLLLDGNDDEQAGNSNPTTTGSTTATTPAPEPTSTTTGESPAWTVANEELPAYITEPVFYEPGTVEAEVEVAYVNAEVSTLRAIAQPTISEPEVALYQTGYALDAIAESRQILLEDGQVIRPGRLTRIEIENVSLLSDTEADVEACYLSHGISAVVDDPSDQIETIGTLHATYRMVRSSEGQWQLSELQTVIQDVDGFGACLDVTLTPVDPGAAPEASDTEPEDTTG